MLDGDGTVANQMAPPVVLDKDDGHTSTSAHLQAAATNSKKTLTAEQSGTQLQPPAGRGAAQPEAAAGQPSLLETVPQKVHGSAGASM